MVLLKSKSLILVDLATTCTVDEGELVGRASELEVEVPGDDPNVRVLGVGQRGCYCTQAEVEHTSRS